MHSIAILLPALSLLASTQAWSNHPSSPQVEKRTDVLVNYQTYTGAIGGLIATPVTVGGGGYNVGKESVSSGELSTALMKSCTNQFNLCSDASNAQPNAAKVWTVAQCQTQLTACNGNVAAAVVAATAAPTTAQAAISTQSTASVASVSSVSTQSTASVASVSKSSASIASVSATSVAATATTAASTTTPNLGIQGFTGHLGGYYATPVCFDGTNFIVGSVTWPNSGIYQALQTSCDDQKDDCNNWAGFNVINAAACLTQSVTCSTNRYLSYNAYVASPSSYVCAPVANLPASTSLSLSSVARASSASYYSALTTASVASVSSVSAQSTQSTASVASQSSVSASSQALAASASNSQITAASVSNVAMSVSASSSQIAAASASNVALSASASNSRVSASSSQASVSSVSAQSTQSTASVASQSSVSVTSQAQAASASNSQITAASVSNLAMSVSASSSQIAAASASNVALSASASNSRVSASNSQASVSSVSAQSVLSTQSTASVASQSSVSVTSQALAASASNSQITAASVSNVAMSVSASASQVTAASISNQALSASASNSRASAAAASNSALSVSAAASQSAISVSASQDQASRASASQTSVAAASIQSNLAAQSQQSIASVSTASIASVSITSVASAAAASASAILNAAPVLATGWSRASTSLIAEGSSGRALTSDSLSDPAMTPLMCSTYCSSKGYPLAGTEWYSECYCGSVLSNGASLSGTSSSDPTACSGKVGICGGASALSLYYDTTKLSATLAVLSGTVTTPVTTLPSPYKVASSSLIAEGSSGRALTGDSTSSSSMTPLVCATYCTKGGFALSGVEYYSECYCGNALSNGASLSLTSANAPTACSGDKAQTCGAGSALSIAYNTALATLTNGVITLVGSTTTTPVVTAGLPSGYKSAASSIVAEGTSGRALTGASTSADNMTPSICAVYCTKAGFALSGTEYASECYCGNALSNGASLSLFTSNSATPCAGDKTITCGAASGLSIAYNTALATLTNGVITLVTSTTTPTTPTTSAIILPTGYKSASSSLIAEGPSGRALTGASTSSSSMTPTVCAQYCTAAGFAISATEYSSECYCGNSFSNGASLSLTSGNSPMTCSGDITQTCGAASAMSVVYNTALATLANGVITVTTSTTTPTTPAIIVPAGYKSASSSLIAEGTSGRALTGASTSADNMTPSVCAAYCTKAGYAISGTEWYTECYCGNSLSNGAALSLTSASSGTVCGGDKTQTCGGSSALSIVYNTALATLTNGVITSTGSSTTTPVTTPVASIILPSGYKSASSSLVAEGPSGNTRALTGASTSASNMTPSVCALYCTAAGFALSGTEYSTECYCGNALSNGASLTLLSSASPMACGGDATQTCGGASALSLVYNTALATLSNNVFTLTSTTPVTTPVSTVTLPSGYKSASSSLVAEGPSGNTRALTGSSTSSSDMTPSVCAKYCTAAGFALSGTEYSTECYCGNSLSNGASLSLLSSSTPMPCGGDKTQTCGGSSALSLVYNTALATLSNGVFTLIAPSPTTTASTTTATTSPAPAATSAAVTLSNGFSSTLLCYSELPGRALTGAGFSSDVMTFKLCTDFCGNAGFSMAGVEWGRECYCSSTLVLGTLAANVNCNVPCSGDSTAICGGPQALQIFTTTVKADTSATLASGWKSAPLCLAEPADGSRLLQDASYEDAKMTVESCTAFCSSKGSNIAGLEYGTQCFCGSSSNVNVNTATKSTNCNMAAGGAQTELAGGGNALSIWTLPAKVTRRRYLPMLSRKH